MEEKKQEPVIVAEGIYKSFKSYETKHGGGFMSSFRRKYKTVEALKGVNLSVNRGEMVALLGKNGSGKSTLIKILTGVLHPDSGKARVLGIDPWSRRTELAMRIGVVFGAHDQLYWNIPALDTFEFRRQLYGIGPREYRERLNYFVKILNLKDVYKRQVRELSLGERMKCNFVASVLHLPEVVFLDEPTIGIDLPSSFALRDALLDINKRYGTTFLIATHVIDDVKILARSMSIMDKGKVIYKGDRKGISHMFGDMREVTAYSKSRLRVPKIRGIRVVEHTDDYLKFEVKGSRITDKSLGAFLTSKKIVDFSVSEPELSNILHKFYTTKAKDEGNAK
ncbi:ABC transporter ATP-binding protein [mine drainage metagenome]|uniref:ABC transporter ATP-binding protein n=1 Tax=mine drainage metagenome TaxID=410659 RepID=T1AKU1_9ZZZZ